MTQTENSGFRVTVPSLEALGIFEHPLPGDGFYIKPGNKGAINVVLNFGEHGDFEGPLQKLSIVLCLVDEDLKGDTSPEKLLMNMERHYCRFRLRLHIARLLMTAAEFVGGSIKAECSEDGVDNSNFCFSQAVSSEEDVRAFVTFVQQLIRYSETLTFEQTYVALVLARAIQMDGIQLEDLR